MNTARFERARVAPADLESAALDRSAICPFSCHLGTAIPLSTRLHTSHAMATPTLRELVVFCHL